LQLLVVADLPAIQFPNNPLFHIMHVLQHLVPAMFGLMVIGIGVAADTLIATVIGQGREVTVFG
jgi:hypothetical protein